MEMFYSSSSSRMVKKYLDEATTDWDVESLRQFLARWHPGIESHETTYLLWRCLHFYAHYPFARNSRGSRIDVTGFQRAIALLVFRGTDSLRTQQPGGHYGRDDEASCREADFRRMLRSISEPAQFYSAEKQWAVDDVMRVLVRTQPYSMTLAPPPTQLREAAERILPEGSMKNPLLQDEFSLIIRLLLQLRVQDVQGSYLPYGIFNDESSSACQKLADSIADAICNEDQTVDAGIVADVLPGLRERFYNLWGVIFQPRCPRETIISPEGCLPNRILAAVSLLLPLAMDASGPSDSALELLPRTEDLGMDLLLEQIRGDDYSHILLFTDETCTAVVGAYIPNPSSHEAESQRRNSLLDACSHFLFQLCPRFCLLRSTGLKSSLEELFCAELNASSLEKPTTTDQGPSPSYSIGHEGGARLRVDPQGLTVTMVVNLTESREENREQELTVHPAQLHILRINPSASTPTWSGNGSKEGVSGEELRKRIHGFGSGNSEIPSPNVLERWNIRRQFYGGTCP
ncbi:hypothetical protein Asppvi_001880 [Aspergillus pseudoviridinutans]|uniref:Uncharacterized protein n=1 Tax=Aspergillus pseudoviridinutans TaxID=1517512 RepID=A0A9P3F0K2_9EURO|nr:uncharacterized protein Asppvi_001880 [Aspergillus pseudoviridinutans]GIJ92602.1 hypothetical protein Asppvi_001880 [Aspergillus pseudoviridinutans]